MRDFSYIHVGWANVTARLRVLAQIDDTTDVSWNGWLGSSWGKRQLSVWRLISCKISLQVTIQN